MSDWNVNFFYQPPMIEINQTNPMSLNYVEMGLPQRNGYVLVDTRLPTIISPEERDALIRAYQEINQSEKKLKFLEPGSLVSINFCAKTNATLIRDVSQFYASISKRKEEHLFQAIDENNFKGIMNIDRQKRLDLEKEFLTQAGLIIGWFMCNRTLSDEINISFEVESEGEIIFKSAVMKTLQLPF